jgi:pimeloyl-ACP methyl ester carboxylesterase
MKIAKNFFAGSMMVASAFADVGHAQSQQQRVKNIVLVHGAFADGTSWGKVIPILEARGFQVVAVQNPLTSLSDDVNATRRIMALQDGPVILVGHSWGGAVITARRSRNQISSSCSSSCSNEAWEIASTRRALSTNLRRH